MCAGRQGVTVGIILAALLAMTVLAPATEAPVIESPVTDVPATDVPAGEVPASAPTPPFILEAGRLSLSPGAAAPSAVEDLSRTTLAPAPAGASDVEEVEIAPRRTVVLSAQSAWDKGFESLSAAFRTLDEVAMAAGFDVRGRPFAVFVETTESGFRYDAMLPIGAPGDEAQAREALQQALAEHVATAAGKANAPAIRFGESPSGKAFRFVHASAYDDIDAAYEAITTYLDTRNLLVRDSFIEEYVTDLTEPTDEALEVYIYVQPRDAAPKSAQPEKQDGGDKPASAPGADASPAPAAAEEQE